MFNEKILSTLLMRTIIGAGLVLVPASITASTAAIAQEVEEDVDTDESKFNDREALATILFGEAEGSAELKDEIATIEADIVSKEAEIVAKQAEVDAAAEADKPALQTELDTLKGQLTDLNTSLDTKNTELSDLLAEFTAQLDGMSDEQVFAANRSFNGWVNNAFDVTLSEDLIALILSGEFNDKQVMFAIRAEFEEAKFNQLADKMDEKGLTDQANRMRDRGETQKGRFNGMVDKFADGEEAAETASSEAKGAAQFAARDAAKDNASNAAKGQAKADAKRAAKDEARQNAREDARNKARNMGRNPNQ